MQQPAARSLVETSVLKESRTACHKARDDFFNCIEDCSLEYSTDIEVPNRCHKARKAYEELCLDSWVNHFDVLKDKEVKFYHKKKVFEEQVAAKAAGADALPASQGAK